MKTETTKIYGLVGFPLGHSFSKKYFTKKFANSNINAEYNNFEIADISLFKKIITDTNNLSGLNVTIPYKQAVIPYLDSLDATAQQIGAVNVIKIIRDTNKVSLIGYNSDIIGFTKSISPLLTPSHKKALVLGTGGASKAIIQGLRNLGLEVLTVSRTSDKGDITYQEIGSKIMSEYNVIVNTTPLGMYPKVDNCPDIPYNMITPQHLVYDIVYNPERTLLLNKASEYGAIIKNGIEMLQLQAEAAWDIWNK